MMDILKAAAVCLVAVLPFSCSSDDDQKKVNAHNMDTARIAMNGTVVLSTTAAMGDRDLTKLPGGCPLKYDFVWKDLETAQLQLRDFSVGKMPVSLNFSIDLKFRPLNSFEKDEYRGKGWLCFEGQNGSSSLSGAPMNLGDGANSGTVKGYFNAETHEVEFSIEFNVMTMRVNVALQEIDPGRLLTYDADLEAYLSALAQS